ncbi:MAG: hypothetical protein KGL95_00890, partial [Patescibacteria group bacterium]|nr:hypothetical protein [Patescibacteria group bacterium]
VTDWPTPPKELWGRADVWQVSSEEIKRQAPIYGTQEDLYGPIAFKAALVLSSEPLFPTNFHQVSLLNQARSDVIQLAREYPNFRDGIIYNLVEVVKRRQIRRGLRKN